MVSGDTVRQWSSREAGTGGNVGGKKNKLCAEVEPTSMLTGERLQRWAPTGVCDQL